MPSHEEFLEKQIAAHLALTPTPYNGDPVAALDGDSLLMDEDDVRRYLEDLFFNTHDFSGPLYFIGSRRVTLPPSPDLLEYWNENWEYDDELERHHVPQSVWDAVAALDKAIAEAEVGYWEADHKTRIELPPELIEEAKVEAAALRKDDANHAENNR